MLFETAELLAGVGGVVDIVDNQGKNSKELPSPSDDKSFEHATPEKDDESLEVDEEVYPEELVDLIYGPNVQAAGVPEKDNNDDPLDPSIYIKATLIVTIVKVYAIQLRLAMRMKYHR